MKAIILAAGRSSRLYPLTLDKPKCLLELEPRKTIIEHQVSVLEKCGIDDILVIVGYLQEKIKKTLGDRARYREFADFPRYNNLHTIDSVRDELDNDILILYSDVIFGEKLVKKCLASKEDFCLLIHNKGILKDTARVKIKDDCVTEFGNQIPVEKADGNFVGIAKFSGKGAKELVKEIGLMVRDRKHDNDYYLAAINKLTRKRKIRCAYAENEPWIEIDFLADYEKAKNRIYPLVR